MRKNLYVRTASKVCILLIAALISLYSCTNNEEAARKLYNKAMTHIQNDQEDLAGPIFDDIVKKYPGTQTAVEVNKLLLKHKEALESFNQMKSKAVRKLIGMCLDSFRLDNGRYPTTREGLTVLIKNTSRLSTWAGPYIKQEYFEYIDQFDYENEGHDYRLTVKRQGF